MDRMTSRSCFCHSGTLCLRKLGVHSFSGVWLSDPQGQDAVLPRAPSGDAPTGRGVLSPDLRLGWREGRAVPPAPYCLGKPWTSVRLGCLIWEMGMGNWSFPSGLFVIRVK